MVVKLLSPPLLPYLTLPYLACSSPISIGKKGNPIKVTHSFGCQLWAMNEDYFKQPFLELINLFTANCEPNNKIGTLLAEIEKQILPRSQ
jgi:hypothetical protein